MEYKNDTQYQADAAPTANRTLQQAAQWILGAVFHINNGDMCKRKPVKPKVKRKCRPAAALVLASGRLGRQCGIVSTLGTAHFLLR
jgi:hypothetical protein